MHQNIKTIAAAIDHIEDHLYEKLDLDTVAKAIHYSKYHLHRMFSDTVGLTIHDYVQRRKLTEAAKLLIFSRKPIIDIALMAGYESRQAFSDAFRAMYKKSPNRYREEKEFYPLQLRYTLNEDAKDSENNDWREKIVPATDEDISQWMVLVRLVIDGFPHLDEKQYTGQLKRYIENNRALILKDDDVAIGIMAFNETTGSIDFLGVHPQYRNRGIAKAFCEKALYELSNSSQISISTFREGDRADTGYREAFTRIGFAEGELLMEFGYPTQRFLLQRSETSAKNRTATQGMQRKNHMKGKDHG